MSSHFLFIVHYNVIFIYKQYPVVYISSTCGYLYIFELLFDFNKLIK